MDESKLSSIKLLASKLRNKSLLMALNTEKKGAHLGGALSLVEVFAVLYSSVLKIDSKKPYDRHRDRGKKREANMQPTKEKCLRRKAQRQKG